MSFGFTILLTLALALVQEEVSGGERSTGNVFGIRIPLPRQESMTGVTLTFVLAILTWAVVLSVSQLAVARQVRGYLMDFASSGDASRMAPQQLMSERLLVEALLALLASIARVTALTAALGFLLTRLAALGLVIACLAVIPVSILRYRKAGALQESFASATMAHRRNSDPESTAAYVDAIYARDSYMHRMPLGEVLVLIGTALVTVGWPAWREGLPASGAGLLLLLVWIQGVLRVATESGVLGWRWSHRVGSRSRASADDDGDDDAD